MRIVAVREWQGAALEKQRYMLPTSPGIYAWMLDLRRPLAGPDQDGDVLLDQINNSLRPSTPRCFMGKVPPYTAVSLHDDLPPLTNAAVRQIKGIAAMEANAAEWALLCPTMFQRPLYVGKAKNLQNRLRKHLAGKTKLVSHLEAVGLTLNDCAIILAEVQPASPDTSDDDEEEEVQESWEELDEESLAGLDPVTQVLLSAAESLTIRMSRPLLNERMD